MSVSNTVRYRDEEGNIVSIKGEQKVQKVAPSGLDRLKTYNLSELVFFLDFPGKERYIPLMKKKRITVNAYDKDTANVIVGKAEEKVVEKGKGGKKVIERFVIDEKTLKELICDDRECRDGTHEHFWPRLGHEWKVHKRNVIRFVPKEFAITQNWNREKRVWYAREDESVYIDRTGEASDAESEQELVEEKFVHVKYVYE